MNIALIGASGFIGSAIRKEALSRKHKVTALVSDPSKLQPEPNLDIQQTDVLDTERNLFSAQLSLAGAKADRFRALVDLYRALGGDWVDEADQLSAAGATAGPAAVRQP